MRVFWKSATAAAVIGCLMSQSARGEERTLRLPYDGNVTAQDLLTGGHDVEALYRQLIEVAHPSPRGDFETSQAYNDRIDPTSGIARFLSKHGDRFLFIKNDFWVLPQVNYDIDKNSMKLKWNLQGFSIGGVILQKYLEKNAGSVSLKGYSSCFVDQNVPASPAEFLSIKNISSVQNAGIRYAISFKIGHGSSPEVSYQYMLPDKNYPIFKVTHADIKYAGFVESTESVGTSSRTVGRALYWSDAEVILFREIDGKILARGSCE